MKFSLHIYFYREKLFLDLFLYTHPSVFVHMLQEYLTIYRPHFTGFGSSGLWRRTGDSGRSERDYPSFWWQKLRRIAFRSDVGRGSKFCWRIQNIDCYTISARRTLTQLFMLLKNRAMFMANIDDAALQRSLLRAYIYMDVGLPGYSSYSVPWTIIIT